MRHYLVHLFICTISILAVSSCSVNQTAVSNSDKNNTEEKQRKELKLGSFIIPDVEKKTKREIIRLYMPAGKESSNWQDYNKAAEAAMRARDYLSAEILLNRSIQLNSKVSSSFYLRGRCKFNSFDNRNDEAAKDLEEAIKMGETGAGVFETLASIYDTRKETSKAINVLTRGIKICGKKKHLYHSRAAIYISMGKKEKALQDYTDLLKINPEFSRVYIMRGQLYEELGEEEKALEDYFQAFENDSKDSVVSKKNLAMRFRAELHSKLGRHKEAIQDLNRVLAIRPGDDELLRLRGDQYYLLKDYKRAIADFTSSIEAAPEFARLAYEARSKAYEAIGKDDLAKEDISKAVKLKNAPAEKPVY